MVRSVHGVCRIIVEKPYPVKVCVWHRVCVEETLLRIELTYMRKINFGISYNFVLIFRILSQ